MHHMLTHTVHLYETQSRDKSKNNLPVIFEPPSNSGGSHLIVTMSGSEFSGSNLSVGFPGDEGLPVVHKNDRNVRRINTQIIIAIKDDYGVNNFPFFSGNRSDRLMFLFVNIV